MITQSRDTRPEVERVQIELLRQKTPAQRLSIARTLSKTVIQLSRKALCKANPDLNAEELNLLFIEFNYGKDLAERYRSYIAENKEERACQIS